MRHSRAHLAIDLGAESGRVIVGVLDGDRLTTREAHRFVHRPLTLATGVYWDFVGIMREVIDGLRRSAEWCRSESVEVVSVGADTWGVDFALVGEGGMVTTPRCYRDPRFAHTMERVLREQGRGEVFDATGIQPLTFNTLYQVVTQRLGEPTSKAAGTLLFMPGLIHAQLGGLWANDVTIASTSQMVDARTGVWSDRIVKSMVPGVRKRLDAPVVAPGSVVGNLSPAVATRTGLPDTVKIIATAGHDTACAVAAVPVTHDQSWCYLSSGTWSLLGVELDAPIITDEALSQGFSNELGVPRQIGGRPTVRFLKNIAGLWLVQECRRAFEVAGNSLSYEALTTAAASAAEFRTLFNVNEREFGVPGHMPDKITAFATRTNQPPPSPHSPGEFIRSCLESLALEYARSLRALEALIGKGIDVVHLIGGGGKNRVLNQMTADATGKTIIVGPYEGTAAGNILVQSMGFGGEGDVCDLAHLRRIVAASNQLETFQPQDATKWEAAKRRYESLLRNS